MSFFYYNLTIFGEGIVFSYARCYNKEKIMEEGMKKSSRFFWFLLLVCALCVTVIACGGDTDAQDTDPNEEITAPQPEDCVMLSDLKKMQIVFDSDGGEEYHALAESVREAIKTATGLKLKSYPDAFYEEKEYEIVLGACEGRASLEAVTALRRDDWFCSVDSKKITLGAVSSEALAKAVEHFVTNVIGAYEENENGIFCVNADAEKSFTGTYDVSSITLGGVDISEFAIIYPRKEQNFENEYAEALAARIEEISGYRIPVYKDSQEWTATHELHIGLTSQDTAYGETLSLAPDAYSIEKVDNKVILAASTESGYVTGSNALLDLLSLDAANDGKIAIDLTQKITEIGDDLSIRVMSYNIYYSLLNETRMSHVIEMIEKHDPDVLGVQEATPEWKEYLNSHLGDVYGIIGEGRDGNGRGEHNLILYRKDRFKLIDSGTWWLSYMPEWPSQFSASSLRRIVTYTVLERYCDGKQYVHFNTHLEHTSAEARDLQMGVLIEIADEYKDLPRSITGDFNAKKKEASIKTLLNSGFSDSYDVAVNAVADNTNGSGSAVIDYCFVTADKLKVLRYRVDTFKYNAEERDPSDHSPVIVDILLR